ncbi:MAG: sugar ABC transporter ATP-binding protein [Verrucomicrobia bacterium]|nr:sugar ABC transporter ATP-binding protein [Verrucomicrobiota bacterium]
MDLELLTIERVTKTFPGVRALQDVSFDLDRGEIHAVVGQNGAGKSTLMHILAGIVRPDSGRILMDGQEVEIPNPARGQQLGISIVHQELSVFPSRSVAENIFVGRLPKNRLGFVDKKVLHTQAQKFLNALEVPLDPWIPVRDLGFSHRQLIEIAKALSYGGKLLILDEPTSALTEHETAILLNQLRRLRDSGIGIIFVSHRLREVFAVSNRITVLRDGAVVGTQNTAALDPDAVITMMVRRTIAAPPKQKGGAAGRPRLQIRGLTVPRCVHGVDLEVRTGEIVGLTGVAGAGHTEVGRALAGAIPHRASEVTLDGKPARIRTLRDAMRCGMVYLPADRRTEGLFLRLSVLQNIVAASLRKVRRGIWVKNRKARRMAQEYIDSLAIRTPSLDQFVLNLSGGNQQKVVLARGLTVDARILIADEPTRGVDVGAKAEVHQLLRRLAEAGKSILLISTEFPEILAVSHRILVMHAGRVVGEVSGAEATEERIMAMASGHACERN